MSESNGVFVNLYDTFTTSSESNASRDRTFIFGTAIKGPRHTPISVDSKPEDIFGRAPNDASFETSLVRGYHEFALMSPNRPDVALIRVGKVKSARASLYENRFVTSGDLSYSEGLQESIYLEALEEGSRYNAGYMEVTALEDGFPTSCKINIPADDGVGMISAQYNLSKYPGNPGVYSSVEELVNAINSTPSFAGKIRAGYTPLETEITIPITGSGDVIDRSYNISASGVNESWGDKLVSIKEIYLEKEVSQEAPAGVSQLFLNISPTKTLDEDVQTIDSIIRVVEGEEILSVGPMDVSTDPKEIELYCSKVTGWDPAFLILGNDDFEFELKVRRNGSTALVDIDPSTYTIDAATGKITLNTDGNEDLILGDRYFAYYRYKVGCFEAKLRSKLVSGDSRSYFILGDTIIFGAALPAKSIINYTTKVYFTSNDVSITDRRKSIIEFINTANMPSVGDSVKTVIRYQPELPAPTGIVLNGSTVQNGAFKGGDDGRILNKRDYVKAVKEAMQAVELYPRKQIVIMGLYLDDLEEGPNDETGMIEMKPLNWFSEILPLVEDASVNVSECSLQIPVRPITNVTVDAQNIWLDKLINNSTTDPNRAANIIDSIRNYKADVPLGLFKVAISDLRNGVPYFANPGAIYAGFKANIPAGESATNRALPASIDDLGIKIQNSKIIGQLNAKRYTTAVVSHTGKFVIADAPTLGVKGASQFDRQFVRDSIFIAVEVARIAAEPFIGKPRRPEYLTAMKKAVMKALSQLSPDIITDFTVDIMTVADGYITGATKLRLILTTAKEIRTVVFETYVKLAA